MAAVQQTPLDELQWRSPAALANLYHFFGGLHRGTIHLYFAESDYMDRTSNNWALLIQNQGAPWLADRDAFEARLRTMQGLEFMVVAEPDRNKPDAQDTGIYVLRKQNRRKRPGHHDDELTVLATYYVIGENIYQAASLQDIVGNKILAASTSLSKFFNLAASLPIYTSSRGYSYFPPSSTLSRPTGGSASASRRSSRAGSPVGAEANMLDAAAAESSSQTQDSSQPGSSIQQKKGGAGAGTGASAAAAATSLSALTHSIRLFTQYGAEFSDTNPLVGEPGSFVFSATARQVQASQAKAQAAAEAAAAAKNVVQSIEGSGKETVGGTSKPPTPMPPLEGVAKAPKRVKRSKSKAGTAPTSPVSPPNAATPGKGA